MRVFSAIMSKNRLSLSDWRIGAAVKPPFEAQIRFSAIFRVMRILIPIAWAATLTAASVLAETPRLLSLDSGSVEAMGWAYKRNVLYADREILLHAFHLAPSASLSLVDAPQWRPADGLETHLSSHGCGAGVNGGYYTPEFTPVGLLVIESVRINRPNRKKPSGILHVSPDGEVSLSDLNDYLANAPPSAFALQSWPFLVDKGGVPGIKTPDRRRHRRTAVVKTPGGGIVLVTSGPLTLYEFSRVLIDEDLMGFQVDQALNLDGGPSTGFFAQTASGPWIYPVSLPVRTLVCVKPGPVGDSPAR